MNLRRPTPCFPKHHCALLPRAANQRKDDFGRDGERKLRACRQPRLHGAGHAFAWHQQVKTLMRVRMSPPC